METLKTAVIGSGQMGQHHAEVYGYVNIGHPSPVTGEDALQSLKVALSAESIARRN